MSSASKQEPSGAGQSTADQPPMTPLPVNKDESSSVRVAQSDRVISPPIPPTPHCNEQPTHSGSLSAEKERSESALTPTAALSLSSLGSGVGRCVCVWCMQAGGHDNPDTFYSLCAVVRCQAEGIVVKSYRIMIHDHSMCCNSPLTSLGRAHSRMGSYSTHLSG